MVVILLILIVLVQVCLRRNRYHAALQEIERFGFSHPGYGHTCATLAQKALRDG